MEINHMANGFEFTVPSTVQTPFCNKTVSAELTQEFVLPDYSPEMRKLLRVTPTVQPPSRFLGIGEAEFSGNVCFSVLYLGADGAPYSTELSLPYSFRTPIENDERTASDRPICTDAAISVDSVSPRLNAPRKLRIHCRLSALITGLYDVETDMNVPHDGDDRPETRETVLAVARTAFAAGEIMELTDELTVPAGEGELRLIESGGAVQLLETTLTESTVTCRGELHWKVLLTRDPAGGEPAEETATAAPAADAPIEVLTRRIPFSQEIELSAVPSHGTWEVMACGTCTGITARVEEDRVLCAATVALEAQVQGSEDRTFVCDCFSTKYQSTCEMRRYVCRRPVLCLNGNVTEGGTIALADAGIPTGSTPIDLSADAVSLAAVCERGRAVLVGEGRYRLLYRTAEGELGCAEFRLPLRYEIAEAGGLGENCALLGDVRAVMLGGRARTDGESLTVDAEWALAARIYTEESVEAVSELHPGEAWESTQGAYVLCYPARGETLWNIAKRYHTAIRPLAALNRLSGAADPATPASLEGVRFLMIG
ncbi:MAG: LysM peptidoglycan-binding domain-containing protein [Clostridia bacterium]|nr:LysM peptidoglycan-binding domain-containing protein [Clostridia bacterium]